MTGLLTALAVVLLLWVSLLFVPFRWRPVGLYLFVPKVVAIGYLPFLAAAGMVLAAVGDLVDSLWITVPGGLAAVGAIVVAARTAEVDTGLTGALGSEPPHRAGMVGKVWNRPLPRSPEPRWRRDVPYAVVPGTDRELLCDVWQPPAGVPPSGLAMVYLYGSGYYVFDKDFGTRPLFRHLAAQGHTVVDVAYRLFPETDVPGMVADAKRAVAWVRTHADELGVDRIVVVGGSAGGHLALLTAYAHDDPALTPADLLGHDTHVDGVASLYGQVRLDALYRHTGQDSSCRPDDARPDWSASPPPILMRLFGQDAARLRLGLTPCAGRCDWLVGGTPDEVPARYADVSALRLVGPDCPPTLLMHGRHDEMAPVTAARQLEAALLASGVPTTAVYLPHTDHAFDLVGVRWSPAARVAIHTLERFLAGIAERSHSGRDTAPAGGTAGTGTSADTHNRRDPS